jgi:hypothetical protein
MLDQFKNNITSQNGEDGIIEEIFNRISSGNKICVEFGAWDGKHLSNVWNLWHNSGWAAVLIEADEKKFITLKENVQSFSNVSIVNRFVQAEGVDSIDNILSVLNVPEVDLLSIDIDGNDYYILQSLKKYRPRVIVIEYNPTIPPELVIIQSQNEYFGASARAIYNLAKSMGYFLAAITDTNLILVAESDFRKLNIPEVDLIQNFPSSHLVYVITSYDGKGYLSKELPFVYNLPTLSDEIDGVFRLNKYLKRFMMRFFHLPLKKRPVLKSDHKIIPVKILKD